MRLGAGHAVAAAACSCQRVRAYGCRRVRLACDELCSARLQGSGAGCSRLPSKAAGCNCICDALQHLASQAAPFCPAGTSCCRCTSNNNKPSPPPADSPASPAASAPPADGGTPSSDPAAASPPLEASAPPASGGVVVPAEQTAQAIGVFYFASTTVYQKGAEVTLNRTLDEAASSGALLSSMQGVTGEPGGGGGDGAPAAGGNLRLTHDSARSTGAAFSCAAFSCCLQPSRMAASCEMPASPLPCLPPLATSTACKAATGWVQHPPTMPAGQSLGAVDILYLGSGKWEFAPVPQRYHRGVDSAPGAGAGTNTTATTSSGDNKGTIIGIALGAGCAVAVLLTIVVVVVLRRRRTKKLDSRAVVRRWESERRQGERGRCGAGERASAGAAWACMRLPEAWLHTWKRRAAWRGLAGRGWPQKVSGHRSVCQDQLGEKKTLGYTWSSSDPSSPAPFLLRLQLMSTACSRRKSGGPPASAPPSGPCPSRSAALAAPAAPPCP